MSEAIRTLIKKKRKITIDDFSSIKKELTELKSNSELYKNICQIIYKNELNESNIKIPEKYINIDKQFHNLVNQPVIEQKSKEWFEIRHNMITASSCAEALNENKYSSREKFLMRKCLPEPPYEPSVATHHGNKYEPIATMLYEEIYDITVKEFGLIPHDKIKYLGASPDGICDKLTKQKKKFSDKYGTMLEIKCPISRSIKKEGKIDGDICPHYYWVQVQIQLECCDLEKCDFWQCKITEYNNREDWLFDDVSEKIFRGAIIQLLPKKDLLSNRMNIFASKYIYPPTINLTLSEYENWIMSEIYNFENNTLSKDYIFYKVIYWKLEESHNQEILRDCEWFEKTLPKLDEFWKDVIYYRENPDKIKKIQKLNYTFDSA